MRAIRATRLKAIWFRVVVGLVVLATALLSGCTAEDVSSTSPVAPTPTTRSFEPAIAPLAPEPEDAAATPTPTQRDVADETSTDLRALHNAYAAASGLHGEYRRPVLETSDDPSPAIGRIPVGPGCEMSAAPFTASLTATDWWGAQDPTSEIGLKIISFATVAEALAFDAAAATGWETCWVENSKRNDFADFVPYVSLPDVSTNGSEIAGRFSETNQVDDGLVANYQIVRGRHWSHLYVWTPEGAPDPDVDRDQLLVDFVELLDMVAR